MNSDGRMYEDNAGCIFIVDDFGKGYEVTGVVDDGTGLADLEAFVSGDVDQWTVPTVHLTQSEMDGMTLIAEKHLNGPTRLAAIEFWGSAGKQYCDMEDEP